jgi:hypothetical protein
MAALTASKSVQEKAMPTACRHERAATAAVQFYKGGLVAINIDAAGSPLVKAVSGNLALRVVGISEEEKLTVAGNRLKYRSGCFPFASSGIDADDVGKICYVGDDQTVNLTNTNAVAGRIYEFESASRVWVFIQHPDPAPKGATAGG